MGLFTGIRSKIMGKKKTVIANETAWDQIEIGDQVKHAKWGVGTVLFRTGMGKTAKAIAAFPDEGQKKLMLKYSKLVKVGSTSLKSVEKLKAETDPDVKKKVRKTAAPKSVVPEIPAAAEEGDSEVEEIEIGAVPGGVELEEGGGGVAGFKEGDGDEDEFSGADEDDDE